MRFDLKLGEAHFQKASLFLVALPSHFLATPERMWARGIFNTGTASGLLGSLHRIIFDANQSLEPRAPKMPLAADHFINTLSDLEPMLIFAVAANAMQCIALVWVIVLLIRSHRMQRQQVDALQTLLLRGIQPEQLIKLASTLARLSETDLEDLLAARGSPPETGSSMGSSPQNR
jgi:hypothetical protein